MGDPEEILQWDPVTVMTALDYEKFLIDYEKEFIRLNEEKK